VATRAAREALPRQVRLTDATFNVAHGAMLALGLATGDLDLVARGLADRLHQPRRASLFPRSMELVERAAELGALGATISGAGPSVLVWTRAEAAAGVAARLESEARGWAHVMRLPFAPDGVEVRTSGM
jgi:homoserine kinase